MPTHEEGKGADEELFHSLDEEPGNEKSANFQWIIVLVCVVLLVGACLVWFELFSKPTPYDDVVTRLHAGMERVDVEYVAGHENRTLSLPSGMDVKCTSAYRIKGASQPLFIGYKSSKSGEPCPHYSDRIVQWCIYVAEEPPGAPAKPGQPRDAIGRNLKLVCHALK